MRRALPWGNPCDGQPQCRRADRANPNAARLPRGNPNATCDVTPAGNPNDDALPWGQPQCDALCLGATPMRTGCDALAWGKPQCDALPRGNPNATRFACVPLGQPQCDELPLGATPCDALPGEPQCGRADLGQPNATCDALTRGNTNETRCIGATPMTTCDALPRGNPNDDALPRGKPQCDALHAGNPNATAASGQPQCERAALGKTQCDVRTALTWGNPSDANPKHYILCPGELSGILYEASGWEEINDFLFGKSGHPPPRALTIAGSDSGGGAGIQADLKTFLAQGVFGTCAVAALTAQNTHGVQGVHGSPVDFFEQQIDAVLGDSRSGGVHVSPLDFFEQQIDAVLGDIGSDVIKTGMLPSASHIQLVALKVRQYNMTRLVVDPVMVSTSGHSLVSEAGSIQTVPEALLETLLPLAELATPNIPEASMLLGGMVINTVADMEAAAVAIHRAAPGLRCVLVKGGHLPLQEVGQAGGSTQVVDVFYDGTSLHRLTAQRIHTPNSHGTGCTLASAIAAELAKGLPTLEAVHAARKYLSAALTASVDLKLGCGVQLPFNHGYMLSDWGAGPSAATSVPRQIVRSAMRAYVVTDTKCNANNGRSTTATSVPHQIVRTARVYVAMDTKCNAKNSRSLVDAVRLAVEGMATIFQIFSRRLPVQPSPVEGGATIVQIRDKESEGGELLAMAKEGAQHEGTGPPVATGPWG
eukprot:gene6909-30887_t